MKTPAAQPSVTAGGPLLLEAVGLSKSFRPVEVLKDVSLAVNPGEVHAIIGENGVGKSTLMKLLAGHLQPTRSELRIDGETVTLTGPVDAERRGIVLVHQEILLAPDLTVAQNVYLGRELPKGMVVDDRAMNEGARQAVRNLGADIDPDVVVRRLSIAQRQLVQIAKVLLVPHRKTGEAYDRIEHASGDLVNTKPTTLAGILALCRYIGPLFAGDDSPDLPEFISYDDTQETPAEALCHTIGAAVEELMKGSGNEQCGRVSAI